MCSISGFLRRGETATFDNEDVLAAFKDLVDEATDRGRDSCGVTGITDENEAYTQRMLRSATDIDATFNGWGVADAADDIDLSVPYRVAINNNRAEPTTEYVADKDPRDVQPYSGGWPLTDYWVTHNGTIANDDDLREQYGYDTHTDIDTAVIPHLLSEHWDGTGPGLAQLLREEVVGSYAFGIVAIDEPDTLWLVTSYKPLALAHDTATETVWFSSFTDYLHAALAPDTDPGAAGLYDDRPTIETVDPYTVLRVTPDAIETWPLVERPAPGLPDVNPRGDGVNTRGSDAESPVGVETVPDGDSERVLVVASGGLDSTTVAADLAQRGHDIELLHFAYRQRAEGPEIQAVKDVADRMDVPYTIIDTSFFKSVIGGSRLTDDDPDIAGGEAGAEFALEWVPARNLIMLAIATGYAEAHGFDYIALGNNLEEAGAYPDNEMSFIDRFNDVLPYATSDGTLIRVTMPVGNLMKHEIVKRGLEVDAPLDLTWSCYNDGERHCGDCGPCFMRKTAFEINDADEVIDYETAPGVESSADRDQDQETEAVRND